VARACVTVCEWKVQVVRCEQRHKIMVVARWLVLSIGKLKLRLRVERVLHRIHIRCLTAWAVHSIEPHHHPKAKVTSFRPGMPFAPCAEPDGWTEHWSGHGVWRGTVMSVRAEGRDESDLEWSDASMRQTACKNTAKHTLGVAGRVVGGQTKMTGGVTDSLMHELIGHPTCHTV